MVTVILQGVSIEDLLDKTDALETPPIGGNSTLDNLLQLMGLILLFIFIIISAHFISKFIAGIKVNKMKDSNFHIIDSIQISQGKILQIIKVGERYILISISKENINFIMELNEDEISIKEIESTDAIEGFKKTLEKFQKK